MDQAVIISRYNAIGLSGSIVLMLDTSILKVLCYYSYVTVSVACMSVVLVTSYVTIVWWGMRRVGCWLVCAGCLLALGSCGVGEMKGGTPPKAKLQFKSNSQTLSRLLKTLFSQFRHLTVFIYTWRFLFIHPHKNNAWLSFPALK